MSRSGVGRRYVAFVRAINVGGHSVVSKDRLKSYFVLLGISDVSTYIQSGNILFTSDEVDSGLLSQRLSERLGSVLGPGHDVFVFTREDLEKVLAGYPFTSDAGNPDFRSHVMFLSKKPSEDRVKVLLDLARGEYQLKIVDGVLYYGYVLKPDRRRRTIDVEGVLGVVGTSRTVKVVKALVDLLGE